MRLRVGESLLYWGLRLAHGLRRREADANEIGTSAIQRILAVSCTALGDTLLSTPAIRSLRLAYPKACLVLLVHPAHRPLFEHQPELDALLSYDGRWSTFLPVAWRLQREAFDVVCILHGNEPQATPLAYLSGARFIFKLPNTSRFRFLLTNRKPVLDWPALGHGIDQRLAVAALAGGAPAGREMVLGMHPQTDARMGGRLQAHGISPRQPLLALQPGASTTSRRWAPSRFSQLASRLLAAHQDMAILITGSPSERSLCQQVKDGIKAGVQGRVWVSAGDVPLVELPALLGRCTVLVSGDTGPMHLAVAVGTSVVALFASSNWRRSGPAYDLHRHVIIQKWRTCDPCLSKRCPYPLPICMENISVEEVQAAVEHLLAGVEGAAKTRSA